MHKQYDIYMANARSCIGDPTPPLLHLFALGVGIRGNANFSIRSEVTQILAFLDTNMLVSPTQYCGVGGLSQQGDPTQIALRRSGI